MRVKVHIYNSNNKEIKTSNFDKIFKVYEKNGKLGIDWNVAKGLEEAFVPFENFSQNAVVFEEIF